MSVVVTKIVGDPLSVVRVIGQAQRPGAVPYQNGITLLDVMTKANGLTRNAAGNEAILIRAIENNKQYRIRLEDLLLVDVARQADGSLALSGRCEPSPERLPELYQALLLAIRDYIGKNGFKGVLLGLSGGIDSALVLALAVDALGADRVRTVMMPSPYTAQISLDDAAEMATRLGVRHETWPIQPCFEAFRATLADSFAGLPEDTTEENIQARIRGTLLMALSNKTGWLVLTTSNKSETAVGYATLYGDMAGGFAPIKDVLKTVVYELARHRNELSPVIPERIITRAPSAELRPDQTDQDSLPPYEVLDRIIEGEMNGASGLMYMEAVAQADGTGQLTLTGLGGR